MEPRVRSVREGGTTDRKRRCVAERWVWWTGINSEWLRSPEAVPASVPSRGHGSG